jgi:hypothetical protein
MEVLMSFRISALPAERFTELFALDDQALAARGAKRIVVEQKPGVPCRVSLADADLGEVAILVPFEHQPHDSPYRASGPIYVRQGAQQASPAPGTVPALLRSRMLSVRAYDPAHLMVDADVVDGPQVESLIDRLFDDPEVSYLHVHLARPGCYACRVDRA